MLHQKPAIAIPEPHGAIPPYLDHQVNDPDEAQPLLYGQQHGNQRTHTNINPTIVIACIACTTAINGVNAGMMSIAIPQIAVDLDLDASEVLWCVSFCRSKASPLSRVYIAAEGRRDQLEAFKFDEVSVSIDGMVMLIRETG